MAQRTGAGRRAPLNRDRVLRAAVALADETGIESLSMRKLAKDLGVVPMALYKHVASKEELLDGMVDAVIGEIDPPVPGAGWKTAIRQRVLSARRVLLRHPWASRVIETRTNRTPVVLGYMDSMSGMFLAGGFSADLTHHVMHALGNRMWGFTRELFDDGQGGGDRTCRRRRRSTRWRRGTRTSSRSPWPRPAATCRRSARAATSSSSSSSRSTCSSTASNGSAIGAGRPGTTASTRPHSRPLNEGLEPYLPQLDR
jgi:AcrR family transcriptional regulator